MNEECMFILSLLSERPRSLSEISSEASISRASAYRYLSELEGRGWVLKRGRSYYLTDRARILLNLEPKDVLGIFLIEKLFLRAVRLRAGGWERGLELLERCSGGKGYVLGYETAAYLRTGYQLPSATFAYVRGKDLDDWLSCLNLRRGEIGDLVLIPVRELPSFELIGGKPVVNIERLRLELLAWLGRGVIDLAALKLQIPPVTEEITDVLSK
ncbi:ArsR family transcriptional regulator [Candidatus Korarchaeum cryptofilum]|jgi:biotin operon repressor|uniref:ArsR family transcriptional regulator n=1 Tax=Candidatus Korarchaeum cryptofilum TaxID=498846 RepID=A0A429FZP8_9CREN|nr:helix-turn-helix domain-containing protein [Candidatus Korarchaeum cryptofilum]RSN67040.1 ArsR family transcriptional regulator [Candidatus Korarchaeum cryptofilum]